MYVWTTIKAALAVGKKVLLMMMRAFAPSAATAFDATRGLGSGLGRGSGSGRLVVNQKIYVAVSNSFYVVFCLIVVYIPSVIQIGQKT